MFHVTAHDTVIKDIYPENNTYSVVMGESSPLLVGHLASSPKFMKYYVNLSFFFLNLLLLFFFINIYSLLCSSVCLFVCLFILVICVMMLIDGRFYILIINVFWIFSPLFSILYILTAVQEEWLCQLWCLQP